MATALDGLKVLDLSRVLAGPWATQTLADLGADVVKVERPGAGDDTRAWGPPWLKDADGRDTTDAAYFCCANRNKRSIAIDIATPEGQALVRRLAGEADVLVENFKVGGLKAYGLDFDSLHALHPRLVYCSITGFGQTGPYAPRAGYDFLIQGMGGLMSVTGRGDAEEGAGPQKVGVALTDVMTGLHAAIGILAALRHRDRTGEGQHLDLALLDVQVAALANQTANHLIGGVIPKRMGNAHPNIVPYQDFPTADGDMILAIGNDGQFARFCEVAGHAGAGQQRREGVEGGDLDGAAAGELLLHAADRRLGQQAAVGADHALAVGGGRRFRVDVQRRQTRHARYRRGRVRQPRLQNLVEVGGRIGADQQHAPARLGQLHRAGRGQRGLAHAALAGEEEMAGVQIGRHGSHPAQQHWPGAQPQSPPLPLPSLMRGLAASASARAMRCCICASVGYRPVERIRPSSITTGSRSMPASISRSTSGCAAKAAASWLRL